MENQPQTQSQPAPSKRKYLYVLVALVIIAIAAFLILSQQTANTAPLVSYDNVLVPQALLTKLTSIPNNVSNRVGIGFASSQGLNVVNQTPLKINNKPAVIYLGAEYCPFCAAERWPVLIALSRFGNFSNIHFMTSSASDIYASTPTFTFYNSTYTSQYVTFVPIEQTTNQPLSNGQVGYVALQTANQTVLELAQAYDPTGSIPFVLFANRSAITQATYSPSVIGGENWSVITQKLYNSSSLESESILGAANLITLQICEADNNTPMSVCSQPYVTQTKSLVGK